MSKLVPNEDIERIVGAKRHKTDHIGCVTSPDREVFILHSQECLDSGRDLRTCRYSLALDRGIDLEEWVHDKPVKLQIIGGLLCRSRSVSEIFGKIIEDSRVPVNMIIMGDYPRLWDGKPNGVVHIAGGCIIICNRYMRQRCEWCGVVLLEYDLALTAAEIGQNPIPPHWEPGILVRVDGHVSAAIEGTPTIDGEGQLPPDCCTFDPETQVK